MPTPLSPGEEPKGLSGERTRNPAGARMEAFEKRQTELWRLTFFLLLVVTIVFAWLSWGTLRAEKSHLEALAYTVGLVVLVVLFAPTFGRKLRKSRS